MPSTDDNFSELFQNPASKQSSSHSAYIPSLPISLFNSLLHGKFSNSTWKIPKSISDLNAATSMDNSLSSSLICQIISSFLEHFLMLFLRHYIISHFSCHNYLNLLCWIFLSLIFNWQKTLRFDRTLPLILQVHTSTQWYHADTSFYFYLCGSDLKLISLAIINLWNYRLKFNYLPDIFTMISV